MNKSHKKRLAAFAMFLFKALNVAFVTLFFSAAWFVVYAQSISVPFHGRGNYAIIAIFAMLFIAFSKLYGGFSIGILRASELIYSNVIALAVSNSIMYCLIFLLTRSIVNPAAMIWAILCEAMWCALWAIYSNKMYFSMNPAKKCIIIYGNLASRFSLANLNSDRYQVIDEIETTDLFDDAARLEAAIEKAESVFLCGVNSQLRNEIIKYCIGVGKEIYLRPHISDLIISGAKRLQMCNVPVLKCTKSSPAAWYLAVKRAFDIAVSLVGLIITSPVLLITALLIKLSDGGPVMFTQLRMTKNRKIFKIYKFRSMKIDAEKDGIARLASQNDDRVTPIGKFIRKVRIDELPQILNILRGEMTIVGPRPERPEIAEQYEREIPEFALRLQAKSGLTGYAQVYGKYNTSPYDKLQMDLMYIANMGLIEDLKIMFATVKILFMAESTEGIKQKKETAISSHDI